MDWNGGFMTQLAYEGISRDKANDTYVHIQEWRISLISYISLDHV